jgi:hypothetical protein
MNKTIEAPGAPRPGCHHTIYKAFGKDTLATPDGVAAEAPNGGYQLYRPPGQRKVGDPAMLATMYPATGRSATWAMTG